MAIAPDQPLRDCPEDQIGVSIPSPLNARLDALVQLANAAGENTSRKELLAALIFDACTTREDLLEAIRRFRSARAADVVVADDPSERYLSPPERRPGPRPRRASG